MTIAPEAKPIKKSKKLEAGKKLERKAPLIVIRPLKAIF
jgi:hypothetical protein